MLTLILLLILSVTIIALAATVSHDGYGSRPGPRSHENPDLYSFEQHRSLR
ncbi:hypothetical protein ACHAAC_05105 [Aeromicrobium sp. CF4.19]|uniref:hypothetical protein n=1 Tax=Aeromicrobium sp. CF4.19 TaxID=3373082 RepID=UPI003EE56FAC